MRTKQLQNKFILIAALIVFFSGTVLASNVVDSLKNVISSTEEDTVRIRTMLELSLVLQDDTPEKALNYAQKSLNDSRRIHFKKGVGESYRRIAGIHYKHNNFEVALENYIQSARIYEELDLKTELATIYNVIGIIHYYQANYEKALVYYLEGLKIYEELGDKDGISSAYNNIGIIYNSQNNFEKALEYHFKSLGIDKETNDKNGIAASYNNIGEIYRELEKYDKALEYYEKSLEINEEEKDIQGIAYAINNIGTVYQIQGNYEMAGQYLRRSLSLHEQFDEKYVMGQTYNNLGNFYNVTQKFDSALIFFNKALLLGRSFKLPEVEKDAAFGLSKTYELKKDFSKAYYNHVLFKEISDSIVNKENLKKITQLEMNNEFIKKQKQQEFEQKQKNLAQAASIKRQRILNTSLFIGFFLVLLIALAMIRSYLLKKKSNLKLKERQKEVLAERKRADEILYNVLPKRTADELKKHFKVTSKHFEMVTIMFFDFQNFTRLCEVFRPIDIINELNIHFQEMDEMLMKSENHIEKIKTIGDAYMCAGGVPYPNKTNPFDVVILGLRILNYFENINREKREAGQPEWNMRVGVHTGEVVSGLVGKIKFSYDLWGDTVNVASRMESSGIPGELNISGTTYEYIKDYFEFTPRGKIEVKNKGSIDMYLVDGIKPEFYYIDQDTHRIELTDEFKQIIASKAMV